MIDFKVEVSLQIELRHLTASKKHHRKYIISVERCLELNIGREKNSGFSFFYKIKKGYCLCLVFVRPKFGGLFGEVFIYPCDYFQYSEESRINSASTVFYIAKGGISSNKKFRG